MKVSQWNGLQQLKVKHWWFSEAVSLVPDLLSLILRSFPNMWVHVLTFVLVVMFWWMFFLFLSYQAIRVLGLLGALDPYKHKVNIGMIDQSRDASAVSLSESKSSQDSCKHLNLF